ncbi:MAG TPA: hypothetical protein VIK22_08670 [Candidatus Anoxymicrobiaceae bacterium]
MRTASSSAARCASRPTPSATTGCSTSSYSGRATASRRSTSLWAPRPPPYSILEKAVGKIKMARNVPRVYKGTHVQDESVMVLRGSRVKVISEDRLVLQADGEVIGEGPFTAEVIKGALDIIA